SFRRLFGRDLVEVFPKVFVAAKSIHHHLITHRRLRMAGTGIMFLIDRMMNDRSSHTREFNAENAVFAERKERFDKLCSSAAAAFKLPLDKCSFEQQLAFCKSFQVKTRSVEKARCAVKNYLGQRPARRGRMHYAVARKAARK